MIAPQRPKVWDRKASPILWATSCNRRMSLRSAAWRGEAVYFALRRNNCRRALCEIRTNMVNDVSAGPLRQPAVCHSRFALLRRISLKVARSDNCRGPTITGPLLLWGGFCQGGAPRVLSIFSSFSFFVRPGRRFFAPTHTPSGRRAQERSRLAVHRAATDRLGLDGSEHDGILVVVGMTTSEGSSHVVHEHSRHILLFGGEDPDHDAPRRRTHSGGRHLKPCNGPGPRHLEPSSATRHERADRAETVGCFVTASLPSVCGTEDDALGHDARRARGATRR